MERKEIFDRLLEKYASDEDVLFLLSENSKLHRKNDILNIKNIAYKEQLKGLHKYIKNHKILEKIL